MDKAATLDDILSIEDQAQFMTCLVNYSDRPPQWTLEELRSQPEEQRMITTLNALDLATNSGGIGQFLSEEVAGALFYDALEFCEVIGASRMVEYLKRVAAYFPGGVVPERFDERWKIYDELTWREDCHDFRKERVEFNDASSQMIESLRAYIRRHKDSFIAALKRQ